MRVPSSERGAALVTALLLTVLALIIALALLTMIATRTKVSASQKRYISSLAAAQGGAELLAQEIIPRLARGDAAATLRSEYTAINLDFQLSPCLKQKLSLSREGWTSCTAAETSPDPARAPDLSFRLAALPGEAGFAVTTKIVDTIPGNSDRSGGDLLEVADSVAGKDDVIRPQHVPAMYNIAVQGGREEQGVREKARLSVLYAF